MKTGTHPITQVKTFYSSLFTDPAETLKTAWRGAVSGESEGALKYIVPVNAGLGSLCLIMGVATAAPVSLAIGAGSLSIVAGHYHDIGLHLPPKTPTGLEAGGPG